MGPKGLYLTNREKIKHQKCDKNVKIEVYFSLLEQAADAGNAKPRYT